MLKLGSHPSAVTRGPCRTSISTRLTRTRCNSSRNRGVDSVVRSDSRETFRTFERYLPNARQTHPLNGGRIGSLGCLSRSTTGSPVRPEVYDIQAQPLRHTNGILMATTLVVLH